MLIYDDKIVIKEDLCIKIKNHLSFCEVLFENSTFLADTQSEAWVVYLFVEIRKLLQHLEDTDHQKFEKFKILYFYCCWSLHIKMSYKDAKNILEELSKDSHSEDSVNFCTFNALRQDLQDFFSEFNLEDFIDTKPGIWFEFRRRLIQVLTNCPLESSTQGDGINKLELIKASLDNSELFRDYFIYYRATLVSGEIFEWNVMLGDYGSERKKEMEKKSEYFWLRIVAKLKLREQNKNK